MDWRISTAVLVAAAGAGGVVGYRLHPSPAPVILPPVIQEKVVDRVVVQHDVTADHIVYRDRIVTVTKVVKPDGTVKETTRTEDKEKDKVHQETADTSTKVHEHQTVAVPSPKLPNYSLGIRYRIQFSDPQKFSSREDRRPYEFTGGYRMVGGVWLDGAVQPYQTGGPAVSLGIRWEW